MTFGQAIGGLYLVIVAWLFWRVQRRDRDAEGVIDRRRFWDNR